MLADPSPAASPDDHAPATADDVSDGTFAGTTGSTGRYVVHVGWGDSPEDGQETSAYRFLSAEARDAFLFALREADGWLGNAVVAQPARFAEGEWRALDGSDDPAPDDEAGEGDLRGVSPALFEDMAGMPDVFFSSLLAYTEAHLPAETRTDTENRVIALWTAASPGDRKRWWTHGWDQVIALP